LGERTRGVGAFPDGKSALMLVAPRLRHIASTELGKRRYLVMETLLNPAKQKAATLCKRGSSTFRWPYIVRRRP
jgi:hypothetical protein